MARPKGTPKTGGRKAGTPNKRTFDATALAERLGYDPLEAMIELARTTRDEGIKVACHRECAKYVYPQRRQTELSGVNGEAIKVTAESSELKEVMADLRSLIDTKINERKG